MRKTILITGASSGLGKETAKLFQREGWNVIAYQIQEYELMVAITFTPILQALNCLNIKILFIVLKE
jgi:NAD(P)-dependent dehydrogenase (short-subunit alcohol dehydrogenase family)